MQLLKASEVCAALKISASTLRRLVRAGKLRPIRVTSRTVRYDSADLERLVAPPQQPLPSKRGGPRKNVTPNILKDIPNHLGL
jgi:excisionase family DNA binding protein